MGSEVLTAVSTKIAVFRDVTRCNLMLSNVSKEVAAVMLSLQEYGAGPQRLCERANGNERLQCGPISNSIRQNKNTKHQRGMKASATRINSLASPAAAVDRSV
jgi:hypothetical protein